MNEQWLEHLPLKDIKEISPVSGGDVNEAYRVETDTDTFFLLVQRGRKESFYAAEIAGLNEFERAGITAPRVIASGEVNGDAYLMMTYLEEGASGSQRQLGQLVAQLHSQQQEEGKLASHYLMKVAIFLLIIIGKTIGVPFLSTSAWTI